MPRCQFYADPLMIPFSTKAARSSFASVMTVARSVAAAWFAFARWAVGVAPVLVAHTRCRGLGGLAAEGA